MLGEKESGQCRWPRLAGGGDIRRSPAYFRMLSSFLQISHLEVSLRIHLGSAKKVDIFV
jgi:hypothetical protein